MKGQLVWEVLLPLLFVVYIKYVLRNPCTNRYPPCDDYEIDLNIRIVQIRNPILMAIIIPSIFSVGQRFILQSMVEDKMNKMRESLRLMSLSRFSYTLSIFLF